MGNVRRRMMFECPDGLKMAVRMRAALENLSPSEVILAALRQYLVVEVGEVERRSGQAKDIPTPQNEGGGIDRS